jgi:hypothetical protein
LGRAAPGTRANDHPVAVSVMGYHRDNRQRVARYLRWHGCANAEIKTAALQRATPGSAAIGGYRTYGSMASQTLEREGVAWAVR